VAIEERARAKRLACASVLPTVRGAKHSAMHSKSSTFGLAHLSIKLSSGLAQRTIGLATKKKDGRGEAGVCLYIGSPFTFVSVKT